MKKIVWVLCVIFSLTSNAQDAKSVKKALDAGKLDEAMNLVNGLVTKDPKKGEAWYLKYKVFNAIANNENFKSLDANAAITAFESFKTYTGIEKNMESMVKDGVFDYSKIVSDMRIGFINKGNSYMTSNNYGDAFKELRNSLKVYDYMKSMSLITSPLDTSITFYTGYCAMKANNNEDAELFYKKIADANASGTDLQIAYGWLGNYYLNDKKDIAKAEEYIAKGLKVFPNDEYLTAINEDAIKETKDHTKISNFYEEKIKSIGTAKEYLNYSAYLFDYIYDGKQNPTNIDANITKLDQLLAKAIELKPNSVEANFLGGMATSQKVLNIDNALKALKGKTTPADVAKVKQLNADKLPLVDAAIKNYSFVYNIYRSKTKLDATEKERYEIVLSNLSYFYSFKKDTVKQKEVEDALKEIKK